VCVCVLMCVCTYIHTYCVCVCVCVFVCIDYVCMYTHTHKHTHIQTHTHTHTHTRHRMPCSANSSTRNFHVTKFPASTRVCPRAALGPGSALLLHTLRPFVSSPFCWKGQKFGATSASSSSKGLVGSEGVAGSAQKFSEVSALRFYYSKSPRVYYLFSTKSLQKLLF
jgi:hypothetical protein